MKILIIDTTNLSESLFYFEYVKPLIKIIKNNTDYKIDVINIEEFNKDLDLKKYKKIILSGTNLKDFNYLKYINKLNSLKDFNNEVLGICAGAQILAHINELELKKEKVIDYLEGEIINNDKVLKGINKINKYYLLTSYLIKNNTNKKFRILIKSKNNKILLIKYKNFYLSMIHPEVRNESILINFLL